MSLRQARAIRAIRAIRTMGTMGCALLIALGVPFTIGCDRTSEAGAVEKARPPEGPGAPSEPSEEPRSIQAIAGEAVTRTLRFKSHLIVDRDVGVTARRDGIVESIEVGRGDHVDENQVLARLDDEDLVLARKIAALELDTARSSFERASKLIALGIMSDEEYEQARLSRDAAEKSLERIDYELEKCLIVAPFDGVITARSVEKGQFVREDDRAVLFQVTALGPLLARIYVPEDILPALHPGQSALVKPEAAPAVVDGFGARVQWINDVVDAASGTTEVLVEILPGGSARWLRPGMSVSVDMEISAGESSADSEIVSIPRSILRDGEPVTGSSIELKVIMADGSVRTRPVVLGFIGDERVEIRSGLAAGERIVPD